MSIETMPSATGKEFVPEGEEPQWGYQVEYSSGNAEHDEVLDKRAERIEELLGKPLPVKLVADTDQYIGNILAERDEAGKGGFIKEGEGMNRKDVLAQNVIEMDKSSATDSYVDLIKRLRGHEGQTARSLDEIMQEANQLEGTDKVRRLQAIKVFSLALDEMIPAHSLSVDWEKLEEEKKALIRVAEITKFRVDVELGEAVVFASDKAPEEARVAYAKQVEETMRDYANGDDLPWGVRVEFGNEADRMKYYINQQLETQSAKTGENKKESVGDDNEAETVIQKGSETDTVIMSDQTATEPAPEQSAPTVHPKMAAEAETVAVAAEQSEAAEKAPESEYVDRPIFGREAIKSKDVKAIQEQLKQLAEKNDARSAFDLARQLAYLKRAGIKLSDRGKEYYAQSLDRQGEAMRERGGRAVAQYHTYLKYLGMEQDLAAEDKAIIRESCEAGGLGNRRHLASLAVNAKYLGVLDDVEFIKDDLEADFRGQLEEHVPADNIALEMARRKYLQVPYKLPEKYEEVQELVDSRLERCVKDGLWDKYVRLKGHVDYVQGGGTVEEENKEKIAGYVEEMAKRARKDGIWQEYSAYIGDAAHLSRHNGKYGQANETKENQTEAESIVVGSWINLESEEGQREAEGGEAKKEDGIPDTGMAKETERDEAGNKRVIDPEQYPNRAQFEEKAKKFNEAQENNPKAWGSVQDILHRERLELKQRENYLLKKRQEQEREGSVEAQWANEAMDRLREGADFSEVVNEDYLMEHLLRHKVSAPEREERRGRYLGIMRNELGLAQMIDEPTMMDRVSSIWMERWYARWQVAKGVNKLKAVWPWGKAKRREVVRARQDMISTIEEAAVDEKVDGRVRALLQRLATEFELMNVRDAGPLAGKKHVSEQKKKKNKTKGAAQPQRGKGRESAAEKEKEASYGGRG